MRVVIAARPISAPQSELAPLTIRLLADDCLERLWQLTAFNLSPLHQPLRSAHRVRGLSMPADTANTACPGLHDAVSPSTPSPAFSGINRPADGLLLLGA